MEALKQTITDKEIEIESWMDMAVEIEIAMTIGIEIVMGGWDCD